MGKKSQMHAVAQESQEPKKATKPDRLFHEINLLHLEGHYFTFDPKAARVTRDPLKELDERWRDPERNTVEPVSITPNLSYGTPSVFAYKVFQAIIKKLSDYGYPAPENVSFGHREIMRLIGRDGYGGKDSKELVKTLHQFRHTGINCWVYDKSTEEAASLSFSLATTFLYTYKKRGQLSLFTIYLHPFIIKSINNQYTFCLNFGRMEKLDAISTALYKHLYFHFSNIYSQKKSKDFVFRKNYAEICRMWLGGLKVLRYRSDILKDQLGKHLEALKKTGLIKSYAIEKNAAKDGFNLVFHPGAGFFEDYEHFYKRRMQAELPFTLAVDETTIQKPQEIVRYFYQKLYGTNEADIGFSEKETAFAVSLLEKHPEDDLRSFIDYGLAEANKTNFDIKTLGGLKKYYQPFTKHLAAQVRSKAVGAELEERRMEERKLAAYDTYRQDEVGRIRGVLSPTEIEGIESRIQAELEAKHPGAKIFSGWVRQSADRTIAETHGVLSFDEWQERCG